MTNHISARRDTPDELGRAIAGRLAAPTHGVSHEVAERLKSARMLALERRRQVAVQTVQVTSHQGGTAVLGLGGNDAWSLWRKAGAQGLLGMTMPEEYGGAGADFLYSAILIEEQGRAIASGPAFSLHNDIVVPYLLHYGSEEQKK